MRGGTLDRRITIQQQTITSSDSGEEVETWSDLATLWARKVELQGAERFAQQQIIGQSAKTFVVRWSSVTKGITTEHRLVYDGRTHDITNVRELGRGRKEGIQIDCFASSEEPLAP